MNEQQRHAFEEALHQKFTGIPLSDEEVNLARWGWQAALAQREPVEGGDVKRWAYFLDCDEHEDNFWADIREAPNSGEWVRYSDWQRTEAARLAAETELSEWNKLKEPDVLHVNLLRGFPARLDAKALLHILGDEYQNLEAERDALRAELAALKGQP